MNNFIKRMENDLYDFGFDGVFFDGEDSHAWYFYGQDNEKFFGCDIKVEKGDYYAWYKENGMEDWCGLDYLYEEGE